MSDLLTFSPPGALDTGTKSFAGAKATFFNAGTTTPRTVYTDQAETIPAASPLVADAAGLWPEIFASGGAVKVVVTYSDDTTGYTLDPCTKVAAAGAGAVSVSFTPSAIRPYDNVQEAIDSGTFPPRTITGSGSIAVTNGSGAAGNPTISFNRGTPVTKTADFTVGADENWLINNKSGSACVVTLPAAAGAVGREIMIQNLQAQAVNSASSNVIPMAGGSAAAAILPAAIGSRATLVSDGTSWRVVDLYVPAVGEGQTWQNVTGSRVLGTTYTNTTGRSIQLSASIVHNGSGGASSLTVAGNAIAAISNNMTGTNFVLPYTAVIPPGATYVIAQTSATVSISGWWELR